MTGTYPNLYYELTGARLLVPPQHLVDKYEAFIANLPPECTVPERARRDVFHTCRHAGAIELIETEGMKPSDCRQCRGLEPFTDHDCGFFGNHTKGVYVSKHADYTFYYNRDDTPRPGDVGQVIMLELVTGRVLHVETVQNGMNPSPVHDCHESPNHLEFYVWDTDSKRDPPGNTFRVIPRYAISWRAVQARGSLPHDGL